jgi:hypothetical protein
MNLKFSLLVIAGVVGRAAVRAGRCATAVVYHNLWLAAITVVPRRVSAVGVEAR